MNDLLDKEIFKVAPLSIKKEKVYPKGGSTHVKSMNKSPLEAYTDQSSGHAFTCQRSTSYRSSFDDSFNDIEAYNPFLSLTGTYNPNHRTFIGEGLFKPMDVQEELEASSIETILIEQSMNHIKSTIFAKRQSKLELSSKESISTSDEKSKLTTRRLRVFEDITES